MMRTSSMREPASEDRSCRLPMSGVASAPFDASRSTAYSPRQAKARQCESWVAAVSKKAVMPTTSTLNLTNLEAAMDKIHCLVD